MHLILGALNLNAQKCEEFLLLKSREKKVLEEIRTKGEASEETIDSYVESHKVSFDAFSFLLRASQENDRWAEENADFEILLAIRNCSSPFLSFSSCCSDVRALFLPIISDSRARSLGKNDLHTTSAISLA